MNCNYATHLYSSLETPKSFFRPPVLSKAHLLEILCALYNADTLGGGEGNLRGIYFLLAVHRTDIHLADRP